MIYNVKVIKRTDKDNLTVDAKLANHKSKYVDWDTFNKAIVEVKEDISEVNKRLDNYQKETNARFDKIENNISELRNETSARFDRLERLILNKNKK
jgi:flagellar capping protein FliD